MKTLRDYIKGYGYVPILLIAQHISNGVRYQLVKQEAYDSFYFMKGDEVIKKEYIPNDLFPKLAIQRLNNKRDMEVLNKIMEQTSYQHFVKFIYEQTGEEFKV